VSARLCASGAPQCYSRPSRTTVVQAALLRSRPAWPSSRRAPVAAVLGEYEQRNHVVTASCAWCWADWSAGITTGVPRHGSGWCSSGRSSLCDQHPEPSEPRTCLAFMLVLRHSGDVAQILAALPRRTCSGATRTPALPAAPVTRHFMKRRMVVRGRRGRFCSGTMLRRVLCGCAILADGSGSA
jgi:hypothetical protein